MATIEELSAALVKADAAGNTEDAKVFADAIRQMQSQAQQQPQEQTSIAQQALEAAAPTIRGFGPTGAGMLAGAAAGSVLPGVGTAIGAGAGAAAAGLSSFIGDPVVHGINALLGTQLTAPSDAWNALFTKLGVPESKTESAKLVEAISGGVGNAAASVQLGNVLARSATPATRAVGEILASGELSQLVAGAGSGAGAEVGRYAAEALGAGKAGQLAASVAGSLLGGIGGAKGGQLLSVEGVAAREIPDVVQKAIKEGKIVMTSDVFPPEGMASRTVQSVGESVPIAGTAGIRTQQRLQRLDELKDVLGEFNALNNPTAIDDVMSSLTRTRQNELAKYVGQKKEILNSLSQEGNFVPVQRTLNQIDAEIERLSAISPTGYAKAIDRLNEFKTDINGKTINNVEGNRKLLGEWLKSPDISVIKDEADKAVSNIYKVLKKDMGSFINTEAGSDAFKSWLNSERNLASMSEERSVTAFRSVLSKGKKTPEEVSAMLFNEKPSFVKLLYRNLDETGKANARTALLSRAAQKATKEGVLDADLFRKEADKLGMQNGIFFEGPSADRLRGLTEYLKLTARAGVRDWERPTGVRQILPLAAAAMSITKLGLTGLAVRAYESPIVRDMLIKLPKLKQGSVEQSALFNRITQTVLSQQVDKFAKQQKESGKPITFNQDTSKSEQIGDGSVRTDTVNGFRIVGKAGQKFRLYDQTGMPIGSFKSPDEAQSFADQYLIDSIKRGIKK